MSGLHDDPAAPLQLGREYVVRELANQREPFRVSTPYRCHGWRGFGSRFASGLGFGLESGDEFFRFVGRELAAGLALVQPERTAGVAKVDVTRGEDQIGELLHLSVRGRGTGRLTKRHSTILVAACDHVRDLVRPCRLSHYADRVAVTWFRRKRGGASVGP